MAINSFLSIITLNVNGPNTPIKRVEDWIKKTGAYNMLPTRDPRNTHILKIREWIEILHANGNDKKAGVTILISDKIDFKAKAIEKDKD